MQREGAVCEEALGLEEAWEHAEKVKGWGGENEESPVVGAGAEEDGKCQTETELILTATRSI